MMLVVSIAPDKPAASANGTVSPSAIPITMSLTVSEPVKCRSMCGVCGMSVSSIVNLLSTASCDALTVPVPALRTKVYRLPFRQPIYVAKHLITSYVPHSVCVILDPLVRRTNAQGGCRVQVIRRKLVVQSYGCRYSNLVRIE